MLPEPLHPAVIHLPIALALLMPFFAIVAIQLIRRQRLSSRSWAAIVLLQALLVASAWIALETGEREEERVERVVAERHIEHHEEAAERFLALAGIALAASALGLLPRRVGSLGRVAGTLATFAVLAAGLSAAHRGGELVYRYGAASAYVEDANASGAARPSRHSDDD